MNGDNPNAPGRQQVPMPEGTKVKYQRWFRINMLDDGAFVIAETRDEDEVAVIGDGTQVVQRQRFVQQSAALRGDVHELFDKWVNRFSDIAVAGLTEDRDTN